MKQFKIVQAYKSLETLSDVKEYGMKEQWNLYSLRKRLRPHYEFYEEKVSEITDKYRKFANENGLIQGENYQNFQKEIEELNNLDIEEDFSPITLQFVEGISFMTAELLEGFVQFTNE